MNDPLVSIPSVWLDWLAVSGYIAFIVFIMWRVFRTK